MGHKESAKDSARVLGRMFDAIEYRGFSQTTVETLAEFAGVPVWNGLTDEWHPTQSLCDMLTMREHANKPDHEIAFAYLGDAHNNVANSLLIAGALMGMDVRMVAPTSLSQPPGGVAAAGRSQPDRCADHPHRPPGVGRGLRRLRLHRRVGLHGRAETTWKERIDLLLPYQVNRELLDKTGNPDVSSCTACPPSTTADRGRRTAVPEHWARCAGGHR